jgi:hypothetical protein
VLGVAITLKMPNVIILSGVTPRTIMLIVGLSSTIMLSVVISSVVMLSVVLLSVVVSSVAAPLFRRSFKTAHPIVLKCFKPFILAYVNMQSKVRLHVRF